MPIPLVLPNLRHKTPVKLPPSESLGIFFLSVVLTLAAFLRFYHLNSYSLWSDEFVTLMIVSAKSCRELIHTCFEIPQPMPPLYFLLTRFPIVWFGPGETSLRLLSAVSSLLVVYLVFRLGRLLFSAEIGLFAALLCAVNTTQIVYAQNARPYAFCLLLSCGSCLMFLRWLDTRQIRFQIGYVLLTTLLFYSHYIFFPLLVVQNIFFIWLRHANRSRLPENSPLYRWKTWITLQGAVALLLLPLTPQLDAILRRRNSLNWSREVPNYLDFLVFFDAKLLFFAAAATLSIAGVALFLKGRRGGSFQECLLNQQRLTQQGSPVVFRWDPLIFLLLWYFVPVILFFTSARLLGLNLFVERYLILSSIPTFLLIAAIPFSLTYPQFSRLFLVIYFLHYSYMEPGAYYRQKGEFSQGIPGANEWRETLTELKNPAFDAPLFLFQSPFIESNQLTFPNDPQLFLYLSSPLDSFYLKGFQRNFTMLPVHWWINNVRHLQFKARVRDRLRSDPEFTLLSTKEFWDNFRPWLEREFHEDYRISEIKSFKSTGALCLNRVQLIPKG